MLWTGWTKGGSRERVYGCMMGGDGLVVVTGWKKDIRRGRNLSFYHKLFNFFGVYIILGCSLYFFPTSCFFLFSFSAS